MSDRHSEEMLERATLAALGGLDAAAVTELAKHLATGCALCAEATRGAVQVVDALGYGVPESEPRAELRDAVLARIAAEAALETNAEFTAHGIQYSRTSAREWRPVAIPGFATKILANDRQRSLRTQLVRLQAGAIIPAHRHNDVEEIFVLEGDLIVNDVLMRAGDYCRAAAESVHGDSRSPNGCVFLVISSVREKALENG